MTTAEKGTHGWRSGTATGVRRAALAALVLAAGLIAAPAAQADSGGCERAVARRTRLLDSCNTRCTRRLSVAEKAGRSFDPDKCGDICQAQYDVKVGDLLSKGTCVRGEEAVSPPPPGTQAVEGPQLYVASSAIWRSLFVPVCWENPNAGAAADRERVRQAVSRTWEANSDVRFTGWGTCAPLVFGFSTDPGSNGIRIRIRDEGPHTNGLGSRLALRAKGMVLNFTFNNWSTSCKSSERERRRCIDAIAVHEFGHALGFAHEQNRPDRPAWCNEVQGSNGDTTVGAWDLSSVMNYCNPQWNNNGRLSATDVQGVQRFYTGFRMSWAAMLEWTSLRNPSDLQLRDLAFGDFDGDGRSDIFTTDGSSWLISYTGSRQFMRVNASSVRLGPLRFGDFNGDGKTDVFTIHGRTWTVYYGGMGPGVAINDLGGNLATMAVGDFDGDGRADVFSATGTAWYISYGGTRPWSEWKRSPYTLASLRFGDFDGDRRTDVFRADGTSFWVNYANQWPWVQVKTSNAPLASLGFGDFDGDHRTDVFRADGTYWTVAYSATSAWARQKNDSTVRDVLGFADFNGDGRTDVFRTR
ncbi:MAG TPA: FG-GAP-like repeat-containing protein [Candidatus Binatia bacterium]|nr:FG-GAP-like repeat-containing protein [Candidatus Binatia bacterium]